MADPNEGLVKVIKTWITADRAALVISLAAVLVSYFISTTVYDGIPHLEDEFAYVWQAEAIASGKLTIESPPSPRHFLVPFVVDFEGPRFGKYPLGWPTLMGVGTVLGIRTWINPLLAGLAVWLTYLLGKKVMGVTVGLMAAGLTLLSPFFLINSGSLLSHPLGLALSAAFALAWLNTFVFNTSETPDWLPLMVAALSLGGLVITRPLTAIAVSIPFAVHGLYLLFRGSWAVRRSLIFFGVGVLLIGSLQFLWQFAATGDPFRNLYTLWWEYDKVGFGEGFGRYGHNLHLARINAGFSLRAGWRDLFGWATFSWFFIPFGIYAIRRNGPALLVSSIFPSLVGVYLAYWVGSWLFGPRYYYEGLYSLTLLTAAGVAWLAGWSIKPGEVGVQRGGRSTVRPLVVTALLAFLVAGNLLFYTPLRLDSMRDLYGISTQRLEPFDIPEVAEMAPALFVVNADHWTEYANLLPLQTATLDSPYIFVLSRGPSLDRQLEELFPDRGIYYYDPDDPYLFLTR
jgi:hypothetical protein